MLPNQAIASTPSAPRPSGAEGRGSTAPLSLQLLRTSQACTRYSAILLEITRHLPLLPQISSDTKHASCTVYYTQCAVKARALNFSVEWSVRHVRTIGDLYIDGHCHMCAAGFWCVACVVRLVVCGSAHRARESLFHRWSPTDGPNTHCNGTSKRRCLPTRISLYERLLHGRYTHRRGWMRWAGGGDSGCAHPQVARLLRWMTVLLPQQPRHGVISWQEP
jgi:hypothetical protein